MADTHPTTLVGTTPRTVEAAFRVLGRGGKDRALRIAAKVQEAIAQAGQAPSDAIVRLVKQIEVAEHPEQIMGALEAIGTRAVDRLKPPLTASRKDGIDFARALEERVIPEEKAQAEADAAQRDAEAEHARIEKELADQTAADAAEENAKINKASADAVQAKKAATLEAEKKKNADAKGKGKPDAGPPAPGA